MNCLHIISLALTVAIVQADQCQQVVKGPEVDFHRVFDMGPWYETYRIHDEEVTRQRISFDVDCVVMTGGKVENDRIIIEGTAYNNESSANILHYEILNPREGVYDLAMKSQKEFINTGLKLEGKGERVDEKDSTISGDRTLILTDYENYLIFATCSSEGKWIIWICTSTPHVTTDQLNAGRNKLAGLGICAEIFPTKCGKLASEELLK